MHTKEIRALIEGAMPVVMEKIAAEKAELSARIDRLESEREKTLADSFQGGHVAGQEYERGSIVQRAGGTYLCLISTDEQPGDSTHWRLIGKI